MGTHFLAKLPSLPALVRASAVQSQAPLRAKVPPLSLPLGQPRTVWKPYA
jgi:hypothetical protein